MNTVKNQLYLMTDLSDRFTRFEAQYLGRLPPSNPEEMLAVWREASKRQRRRNHLADGHVEYIKSGYDINVVLQELEEIAFQMRRLHFDRPCSQRLANTNLALFWRAARFCAYPDLDMTQYICILMVIYSSVMECWSHNPDPFLKQFLRKPYDYIVEFAPHFHETFEKHKEHERQTYFKEASTQTEW
jgi:hypothetical protein